MRTLARMICVAIICACLGVDMAAAQPATMGCSSEHSPNAAQILRCRGGAIIVAENGATYALQRHNGNGNLDFVNLQSKALLVSNSKSKPWNI